ncbi:MAG: C45 family autoproteolytic acyltransferase/hydrolase [Candidatus Thorarchaeota archaeon]
MVDKYEEIIGNFEHLVLEGTSYEIGRQQGVIFQNNARMKIKQNKFPKREFFTSAKLKRKKSGFNSFAEIEELQEIYCPGITEEIKGFAESLGVLPEVLAIHDFPYSTQNGCTGLVFLPKVTVDGRIYVARTYDWHYKDEDNRLCSTRIHGKFGHIGFSTLLFGRLEGLNERGLCIIMTGGGAWNTPVTNKKALPFWIPLRGILEKSRTTREAVDNLIDIPIWTSTNYLIADPSGHAALVEGNDSEFEVKEIDLRSDEHFLYATNVYTLQRMIKYNQYNNPWLLNVSKVRRETIEKSVMTKFPYMDKRVIKNYLAKEIPEGFCAPWQSGYFGALWASVYDVTERKVDINFGTPSHSSNKWYTFTPTTSKKNEDFEAIFVDKGTG